MSHRPIVLLAGAMLALVPATRPARAQAPPAGDSLAVLAVVDGLFDAMARKDTAAMRRLFDPGARLVGMRPRADGTQRLQSLSAAEFIAFVARDARAEWRERAFAPEVRIRGSLATVWAWYDFHFGPTFSHCGVDAVQLLRTSDGWRIVSIADTYETSGCPVRPAPDR